MILYFYEFIIPVTALQAITFPVKQGSKGLIIAMLEQTAFQKLWEQNFSKPCVCFSAVVAF
jgi:hypothetical protein